MKTATLTKPKVQAVSDYQLIDASVVCIAKDKKAHQFDSVIDLAYLFTNEIIPFSEEWKPVTVSDRAIPLQQDAKEVFFQNSVYMTANASRLVIGQSTDKVNTSKEMLIKDIITGIVPLMEMSDISLNSIGVNFEVVHPLKKGETLASKNIIGKMPPMFSNGAVKASFDIDYELEDLGCNLSFSLKTSDHGNGADSLLIKANYLRLLDVSDMNAGKKFLLNLNGVLRDFSKRIAELRESISK